MAAKKDDPQVETAELTPEIKEELFTAPIDIIPTGAAPAEHAGPGYDQNSGTFVR